MTTIELHPAFSFDCDSCGREGFHRGVVVAFSAEDMATIADLYQTEGVELAAGVWHFKPATVECTHCGAVFSVAED